MAILPNFNRNIKLLAEKYGFVLSGISPAGEVCAEQRTTLEKWLQRGYNADMSWFKRNHDLRLNPCLLVEGAKSVISLAYPYRLIKGSNIASYAHNIDYHYTLKEKLNNIINDINNLYSINVEARVFTDSAPILERYWAKKSGLGWIGRSGMLINKEWGSNILLAEIVCDCEADSYDTPILFNGCEGCMACVKSCPTGALGEGGLDARRCISYLTIEHRGEFCDEQLALLAKSDMVYGCDRCITVCKWNAKHSKKEAVLSVDDIVLDMTGGQFKATYKSTPLEKTGLKTIKRNIYARKLFK